MVICAIFATLAERHVWITDLPTTEFKSMLSRIVPTWNYWARIGVRPGN